MPKDDVTPLRPWQELAKLTAEETDPLKAWELAQELTRALDAESRKYMEKISAQQKANEKEAA
jgi:hypothetical protein